MGAPKGEIVTFKADASLLEALRGVPNRSAFIRAAVLAAAAGVCPLCRGTGTLTPKQREHWKTFARSHAVRTCRKCRQTYVVCRNRRPPKGA